MLSSIIGHEQLKKKLAIRLTDHPEGALIFTGPASVGKRTTAFEASKVILCTEKAGKRCECHSCNRFRIEHPDFLCIGQHEKIKVDDVVSVIDFCRTTPLVSNNKVIVIDNANNITGEAANRLLKIIEEPPKNFTFILVTAEPQRVIPTILSRCVKYEFGNLNREELTKILQNKLGFTPKKAEILGLLAADSSLDVFSNAGLFLRYRQMAIEFLSGIKTRSLYDSLDYVDKIEKGDLPIFIDMIILVISDFLLLKSGITKIANIDVLEKFTKITEILNPKALMVVEGLFGQVKRYQYLNINLNLPLKNAVIKSHPYFTVGL